MQTNFAIQPQAVGDALLVFLGSPWGLLAAWLLAINFISFLVFGVDKWKAKQKEHHESIRRVPEKTLFLLSAAGGSAGALLGMKVFHHKTLHKTFRFGIPALLLLQFIVVTGIWVYFHSAW